MQFYQKETPVKVFSCEFCKIYENTYFVEHLRTVASIIRSVTWWKWPFTNVLHNSWYETYKKIRKIRNTYNGVPFSGKLNFTGTLLQVLWVFSTQSYDKNYTSYVYLFAFVCFCLGYVGSNLDKEIVYAFEYKLFNV